MVYALHLKSVEMALDSPLMEAAQMDKCAIQEHVDQYWTVAPVTKNQLLQHPNQGAVISQANSVFLVYAR